jgi:ABC-type branched-subunit amino acid transport system permease subunit
MNLRALAVHPLLWTAIAFAVLPFVAGANPFAGQGGFVDIATTMLIFALFASGFNLLLGHVGELSFGHAMFFAIGAYATALTVKGFNVQVFGFTWAHAPENNMWLALGLSLALVLAWAILLARLIVPRSSGVYYSMITLAFAQVIFFVAFKWGELTGGEDGLQGIPRPILPGLPDGYLHDSFHFYVFTAVVVYIGLAIMYWLTVSPFGTVLHAIRENKIRARFLGYDVNKFRVNAFVLSAVFPAVAGWLWTYYQQSINPDASSVSYSGNLVMMSLLGGVQTFFGPILGSIVYWELQNNISQLTKYWEAWIGLVFVVFVLAGPRGIMGVIDDARHYGVSGLVARVTRKPLPQNDKDDGPAVDELGAGEIRP